LRTLLAAVAVALLAPMTLVALTAEILTSVRAIPAHFAGRVRDATGFAQSAYGQYFVFDRRGHAVYGLDEAHESMWSIVEIGAEPGRIIEPTAFAVAADGSFVIADAPRGQGRIQVFTPAGFLAAGFFLPGPVKPRLVMNDAVVSGIGSLQYTGSSILISQPESGALVTEYSRSGTPLRSFGRLRPTGQEADSDVHLALNSGIPLIDPTGGVFFVFQAGMPVIRKYDGSGELMFERQAQGPELDPLIAGLARAWPRNADALPVVAPSVRAATVDRSGHLWVSFAVPYTYVFDRQGDKVRVVQLRAGGGIVSPSSLVFGPRNRLLVTPGLLEFDPEAAVSR
jgi:hypothetical protein